MSLPSTCDVPCPQWLPQREQILWDLLNISPDDRRFTHQILGSLRPGFAAALAHEYREQYLTQGRRAANIFLRETRDELWNSTPSTEISDDELISYAQRKAESCFSQSNHPPAKPGAFIL